MKRTIALLVALISLGCASGQKSETFRATSSGDFACRTSLRPVDLMESGIKSKPAYLVECTLMRRGDHGVMKDSETLSLVCIQEEVASIFAGDTTPAGSDLLSDGFEISVLIPSPDVSDRAVVSVKVNQDGRTVWSEEQRISVAGRSKTADEGGSQVRVYEDDDVREVLENLVLESGMNAIIAADVQGTLNFVAEGSASEVLLQVLDESDLALVECSDDLTPNLYRIARPSSIRVMPAAN